MHVYEITTGAVGKSYVRAYAWAESEDQAREMFTAVNPQHEIRHVRDLFDADDPAFCTPARDDGFPEGD